MISDDLQSRLASLNQVTAKVGARIYPTQAPQGQDPPYVVFQQVSVDHIEVMAGSHGLGRATTQITSWARTYRGAHEIAEEIRLGLQGYSGGLIDWIHLEAHLDTYDPPAESERFGRFGVLQTFGIWHTEQVPAF